MTQSPLDDIRTLMAGLPGPDEQARAAAAAALAEPGGLGRLEDLAVWLAAWTGKARPEIRRPIVAIYAGAPAPGRLDAAEAGRERLEAIAAGAAVVSRMAGSLGAGLEAFDLAIDRPIGAIETAPALGERECAATMAFGMEVLAKQPDVLMLAEIVPDAGKSAAAVACALFGGAGADWAGADGAAVDAAVARAKGEEMKDGLDVLRQLGGREIAAAAGVILGARAQKVPVILDGFGPLAAAAALRAADARAIDHCLVAQRPAAAGPARLVELLGLAPLVDLGAARADGTGALAALSLVKLSVATISERGS